MIEELVERAAGNPAVLTSIVALGIFYLVRYVFQSRKSVFNAPKLYEEKGNKDLSKLHAMVRQEFQGYKDKIFKIGELHGETLILPAKYMEELKALPNEKLSFMEENDEMFLTKYNLMTPRAVGGDEHTAILSVKNDLTRSLGVLMEDIWDEMIYAFDTEMPACEDWTEVNINDKLIRIVALVSGRVFIGNPLNRNEDYMNCIIMFTMNVFFATPAIRKFPPFLRWAAKYWSPEVKAVYKSLETMKKVMEPVIKEQLVAIEQGTAPRNMNTWNMTNSPASQRGDLAIQAHFQLNISMAAIHTTSMSSTHILFDLAARPEYLEPLRAEIAAVKATESTPYLSKTSMPKLKKLDSFMKESQRLNPLSILNMRRKVKQDIALHDGVVLPANSHIAFASAQIASDPALWEEPEKFDGFRFSKLRQNPGSENKHQFVTTGRDSLFFGHGVHACPGRFFANNEIKLILVHIIENYDIKFKDGQGRPANVHTPGGYSPDRSVPLLMKKRTVA